MDILAAVEDVKQAIEIERRNLAQSYLESSLSSGKSLNAVAEFYENLHQSGTYKSYVQAKDIFSLMGSYARRFANKDVAKILDRLESQKKVSEDVIKRSHLNGFQKRFEMADTAIQEKTRAQLHLLQLQVRYSLAFDVKGLQSTLKAVLQEVFRHREQIGDFFAANGLGVTERRLGCGPIEVFPFERPPEISEALVEENFMAADTRELIEALLRAEETTLKQILSDFKKLLIEKQKINSQDYFFKHGLAEYYVLTEIECFANDIEKTETGSRDLELQLAAGLVVIRDATCYDYRLRREHGHQSNEQN